MSSGQTVVFAEAETSRIHTGTPAVPLRDYFAATVSESDVQRNRRLLAADVEHLAELIGVSESEYNEKVHGMKVDALVRFKIADAMMEARGK